MEKENHVEERVYLPDDLLEEILNETSAVSDSISSIFDQINRQRQQMRDAMIASGRVELADALPRVDSPSVAAIDGGVALERSLGADTALVVALGVEGLVSEGRRHWSGVQYAHWQKVLVHKGENTRGFALGVMASLELEILVNAPHEVVILDGSHLTPVIGINSMLGIDDAGFAQTAAALLTEHRTMEKLHEALRAKQIIGMVKYDASRELAETWLNDFECACDDRTAMTMLLEPGEYTTPIEVGQTPRGKYNWEKLHISIAYHAYPERDRALRGFETALKYATDRRIHFTYYKPHEWSPAYRIELKQEAVEDREQLSKVLTAIRDQVVTPEIREPYPQYLADIMAKSVSGGMSALRAAVFHELGNRGAGDYLRLIVQSYRTES